jgi:MarR family transcriptional regulator, negative regulator of the multidrug operon emrRAB
MQDNKKQVLFNGIRQKLKKDFPELNMADMSLMMQFGMTARKMVTSMENYFSEHKLTKGKFHVLMMLYGTDEHEHIALSDMSSGLQITKSTVTGLTDGLEKLGYVERYTQEGEDRRKIFIRITKTGKEFIKHFFPGHVEKVSAVLSEFSLEEKQNLRELLAKIEAKSKEF